jgi:heat shock protein HtpX
MGRRRELFPRDPAADARMALALVASAASALLVIAVVGWLAVAVEWRFAFLVVLYAAGGLAAGGRRHATHARTSPLAPRDERRARELLARLAALAGLRPPRLAFEPGDALLSWTTALPARRPTIHVTTGLVTACSDRELQAVVAHELAHIANRDAWVMTLVAAPSWILAGIQDGWRERTGSWLRNAVGMVAISWLVALALPGALAVRLLSRQRELAADRGAALLTGSPAGVAAALRRLSADPPPADLRLAVLNFVGARDAGVWATHPPLAQRLAQLDHMERALQSARPYLKAV